MVSTTFTRLLGQPQAVELLTQAVAQNRIAPAYLFAGAAGVGRSVAVQGFLELLLQQRKSREPSAPDSWDGLQSRLRQRNHPDLLWVEPTYVHQGKRLTVTEAAAAGVQPKSRPQIRLEQIRQIAEFLSRPPLEALRSVVVLEDAETMAEPAANGLLKTLEEPGQATLILLAPMIESLLPTLVSRCQRIPFYRLNSEVMAQVLEQAGHSEILSHPQVMALAQGSPGAAIAHWQKLQSMPDDLLQVVAQPPTSARTALELARQIDKSLDTEAQLWLVDYLQQCYWQARSLTSPTTALQTKFLLQHLEKGRQALLGYANPRLVWEVTLLALSGCL